MLNDKTIADLINKNGPLDDLHTTLLDERVEMQAKVYQLENTIIEFQAVVNVNQAEIERLRDMIFNQDVLNQTNLDLLARIEKLEGLLDHAPCTCRKGVEGHTKICYLTQAREALEK